MNSSKEYPSITSKPMVLSRVEKALELYHPKNIHPFIQEVHKNILQYKIKYPLLEFTAKIIASQIPFKEQEAVADKIVELKENGSPVIAGILLQLQLPNGIHNPIDKACKYMIIGNEWYVCDIIGERVMGYALLTQPGKTIPVLKKLATDDNKWLVRSVGVATHYATKKGLNKAWVEEMFLLLFSLSHTTEFHTKTGVGWGAKTIAKFYPEIISKYQVRIDTTKSVRPWFKTKIKIGLGRSEKYAGKYNQ